TCLWYLCPIVHTLTSPLHDALPIYVKILSSIVPAGAVGVSLLLGSTAPSVAKDHPSGAQPSAADAGRVSERLAAIREAVSAVARSEEHTSELQSRGQLVCRLLLDNK